MTNLFTGEPFEPVGEPGKVESVITRLPTGDDGAAELWKLNHYYERLPDWEEAHGLANPFAPEPADAAVGAAQPHGRPRGAHQPRRRHRHRADVLAQLRTVLDEHARDRAPHAAAREPPRLTSSSGSEMP